MYTQLYRSAVKLLMCGLAWMCLKSLKLNVGVSKKNDYTQKYSVGYSVLQSKKKKKYQNQTSCV